jgi:superkiller protein 3
LHYHAAKVFESNNSLEVAARHYQDAIAKAPQDARLHTAYARLLDRAGRFTDAEAEYRKAIELNPKDASALNDLAMCNNRQQRWDAAVSLLQQAIQKDPGNPLYRNNLALVLIDAGRPVDAFNQMASVHGEAGAHYNLGYMLLDRGKRQEAEQHFARALELNPQLAQARQMLEYVQLGQVAQQASGTAPAVQESQTSLSRPNAATARLPQATGTASPFQVGPMTTPAMR